MDSARVVVVVTFALLFSLLGQTSFAAACREYASCTSCASAGEGCMWALLYNCTEACIDRNYADPDGFKAKNVIWRSAVRSGEQCPGRESCEIVEGDVPNPSLESWTWKEYSEKERKRNSGRPGVTVNEPWIFAKTISVWNYTALYKELKSKYFVGLDGEFFLFLGGNNLTDHRTFEVRLDSTLRISEGATHLSFFYALPFYHKHSSKKYAFVDRTALDVYIDSEHLLHIYNKNINETLYAESDAFYHPMNIDISRFADGKNHSLMLYFTGPSCEPSGVLGQLMLIDYIQVIKSNCK